jgi:hypothetical protein
VPTKKISVREIEPGNFAVVGADGRLIRDGFRTLQTGWMWAARKGLHKGRNKLKPALVVPPDLENERILGLPLLAKMSNRNYGEFLADAKAGVFGPLLRVNDRHWGIRLGDWKAAMAAREIKHQSEEVAA